MYPMVLVSCFLWIVQALGAAEAIGGFWKTINENGEAQSIIAIYEYQSLYYGRILGTFNPEGKMDDTIHHPIKKAPGVADHPYYSGLDILWDLRDKGSLFKGKVMDPSTGKVYQSELWRDGEDLIVRGKLFIFGRSQKWVAATAADFPADFQKPDLQKLVPVIPRGSGAEGSE